LITICKALLLILFLSFSENPIGFIKDELSIQSKWKIENPVLTKTEKSLFNNINVKNIFIFPISISTKNEMYFWDCENRILDYMNSSGEYAFSLRKEFAADGKIAFSELIPSNKIDLIVLTNQNIIKSKMTKWRKDNNYECPGNYSFSHWEIDSAQFGYKFSEEDIRNLSEKLYGNMIGIILFSSCEKGFKIGIPVANDIEMDLLHGDKILGIGWDLNQDNILDIFTYIEKLSNVTSDRYFRLYLNLNGKWECKWVELIEDCI
jgi:hypothetical protein